MRMGESIYWLIGYWIELIKVYFMMEVIFRCKFSLRPWKVIMANSAIILFVSVFFTNDILISAFIVAITMFTIMVLLEKKREIQIAFLSIVIISITDVIFSSIMGSILDIHADEIIDSYTISTLMNMQSLVLLLLFACFLRKKRDLSKISYSEKTLRQIVLITIGLCFIILFFVPMQIINMNVNSRKSKLSLLALIIGVLFFIGMALANIVIMIKREQTERDNEVYRYLLDKQEQMYVNLLEHENETKRFRHDIYHHMNCIKQYLKNNEPESAVQYIDDMYGLVEYSYFISTGNVCLDIVINNVWKDYHDKVVLQWKGMFPPKTAISDIDICILFSNLFRNALEATAEVPEQKEIIAKTKVLGNNIVFTLTNPYIRVDKNEKDELRSTKSVHRGYGMRNIQEIVKKYGGTMDIETDRLFTVEIILLNIVVK